MSLYELLLSLHVLAIATWLGSGLAITVIGLRTLGDGVEHFAAWAPSAGWWAGRAHPAAGVLLLLTGFGMVLEADLSLGEPWILVALVGLVAAMGLGGAVIGPTSDRLTKTIEAGGGSAADVRVAAERLLLFTRVEIVIIALVAVDMVVKPGL